MVYSLLTLRIIRRRPRRGRLILIFELVYILVKEYKFLIKNLNRPLKFLITNKYLFKRLNYIF